MFRDIRAASQTLPALVRATKKNTGLRAARLAARAELQSIYDHIAFGLRLPRLPLYLPLRKRVRVGGGVLHFGSVPKEIRLFPFWGVVKKQRRDWQPSEIGVTTPIAMCEILLHETAHVHQLHFEHTGDHEHSFVRSYVAIEEVMLGFGFGPLLPQRLRLLGCPPGSYAASMQATPRLLPTQPASAPTVSPVSAARIQKGTPSASNPPAFPPKVITKQPLSLLVSDEPTKGLFSGWSQHSCLDGITNLQRLSNLSIHYN